MKKISAAFVLLLLSYGAQTFADSKPCLLQAIEAATKPPVSG